MTGSLVPLFLISLLALLVAIPTTSLAAPQLRLEPTLSYYHYREVSESGDVLNREQGPLYGLTLSLAGSITPEWFWSLHAQELRGKIDYTGQTQSGAALNTQTHRRHQQWGGRVGRCLTECRSQIYGGALYYERERDIRPEGNALRLLEHYQGWELGVGARHALLPERLSLMAEVTRTYASQVQPDLRELGYGRPVVELPGAWGLQTAVTLHLLDQKNINSSVHLGYAYRKTQKSNTVLVSRAGGGSANVRQPENEWHHWFTGINIQVRY